MRQIEHRQHANRLHNGLGRSSCEGIVHLCWILAENEGPSCSSTGWERKQEWFRENTKGTSSIILKGCHWGRPPELHIKLTGRSCLKRQCTHMGFNNVKLIAYQWFSWASQIVCVLCIDKRASCFYASAGTTSWWPLGLSLLPAFSCSSWVGDWSVWYPPTCWLSAIIEPRNGQYTFLDEKSIPDSTVLSHVSRRCLTTNKYNIEYASSGIDGIIHGLEYWHNMKNLGAYSSSRCSRLLPTC